MSEAVMKKLEEIHADLRKGLAAWQEAAAATRARDAGRPAQRSDGGAVFPPYGRSKGMPVAGASRQDLDFYRSGCERSLNDPSKARWHEKEQALLEAIDAEIAHQEGGNGYDGNDQNVPNDDNSPPPHGDDDAPPDDSTPF